MGRDYDQNGVGFATVSEQLAMAQVLSLLLAHAPTETTQNTINWTIGNIGVANHHPVLRGLVFRRSHETPNAELEAILQGWADHLGVKVRHLLQTNPGHWTAIVRAEIEDVDPRVTVELSAMLYGTAPAHRLGAV